MIGESLPGLSFSTPYAARKTEATTFHVNIPSRNASPSPLPSPSTHHLPSFSSSSSSSSSSTSSSSVTLADGSLMSVEVGSVSVYEFGRTTVQKGVFFRGRQFPASASASSTSASSTSSKHEYLDQIRGDLQSLLLDNYSEWDDHMRESLLKMVEGEPYLSSSTSTSTSTSTSFSSSASFTPAPSKSESTSESSSEDIVYFAAPESAPSPAAVASSSSSSSSSTSYIESVRSELDELLYTHSSDDDGMRETLLQLMYADECEEKLPSSSSSSSTDSQQESTVIPPNTVLWSTPITRLLPSSSRTSIQVGPHEHAELNKHMMECYVNHSCAPNLCVHSYNRTTKRVTFRSVAPIKVGDQLCVDYEHTEDRLAWPFTCNCCQETCRGIIIGKEARGTSA